MVEVPRSHDRFEKYAVSTDAKHCAKIGSKLLGKGGNAIEAAIGTLICMGLVIPNSLGIGGGCMMTIYEKRTGKSYIINGREMAPRLSDENMFEGNWTKSRFGPLSVGIPGELAAYAKAYEMFGGNLKWSDLFEDSINMAKEGIPVVGHLSETVRNPDIVDFMSQSLKRIFINSTTGQLVVEGDKFHMSQLVETLEVIRDQGSDAFYRGHLGELFVRDLQSMGGRITMDDLKGYSVIVDESLKVEIDDDLTLFTQPVPGSGIILSIIMRIMKRFGYYKGLKPESNLEELSFYHHRLIEAFKYAYAQRASLEDMPIKPERMKRLIDKLSSKEFIDYAVNHIDGLAHNDTRYLNDGVFYKEDSGTAHVSVIDPDGNAIAVTSSINIYFGSGLVSDSTGIIYNNVMDDFVSPNIINYYGVRPSKYNRIRPGRRPLSSMSPSVFVDGRGQVVLAIGASGGTKITTGIAIVSLNNLFMNQDLRLAVESERIHHQFLPDFVEYEAGFDPSLLESLISRGHKIKRIVGRSSVVMAIGRVYNETDETSTLVANSDIRKGGSVAGL